MSVLPEYGKEKADPAVRMIPDGRAVSFAGSQGEQNEVRMLMIRLLSRNGVHAIEQFSAPIDIAAGVKENAVVSTVMNPAAAEGDIRTAV